MDDQYEMSRTGIQQESAEEALQNVTGNTIKSQSEPMSVPEFQLDSTEKALKIFGTMQLFSGIAIGVLSAMTLPGDEYSLAYYDGPCVVCSVWFIVTGCLGLCISVRRIRIYIVLSVISASVFSPTAFALSTVASLIRSDPDIGSPAISAIVAYLSLTEFCTAFVVTVCCCCYLPTKFQHQKEQNLPSIQYNTSDSQPDLRI